MASGSDSQKLALRVKSKKSQNAVLRDVDPQETVQSLLQRLSELTGIPEGNMALLKGFPPKRISYETTNLVESLGLQNQDTIIVEADTSGSPNTGDEGATAAPSSAAGGATTLSTPESDKGIIPSPGTEDLPVYPVVTVDDSPENNAPSLVDLVSTGSEPSGLLLRQIVPSDNSCLFTSVTYCLSGEVSPDNEGGSSFLRELIANTVAADTNRFNEAILGRPNEEYVSWIKKPESWGGGIELSILAEFYGMQISVVDTQSLHISNFGEDQNYSQRIFIIYDGIHYDPLYFESFNGGTTRTIFEVNDIQMNDLAMQLAREAHASNQFTDLKNFSLRCQNCNTLLKGQEEAQAHAKKTAHTAFAEIVQKK
ncbi:unnamed protein product [Orchesella dallaii]|uniref:Ubiquitin thioesterase OTU n=1 Tax=Orchesella dallaii TaxID=48710 RepID=A0ABP1R4W8_9HEXA